MNIYLAARYSRHPEMRNHAHQIEAFGHTITSRWINGNHEMRGASTEDRERFAVEDLEDLTKSDVVISFTEDIEEDNHRPSKGGRHVEFGLGIALNKRMVVVGPRENVFHCLPSIEVYSDLSAFLRVLDEEEI